MNRRSIFLILCIINAVAFGQLSGVKTIPGNYATIAAAVADLNAQGVGPGGVTFNVSAGHTENITAPITVTATGTSSNPIVFSKSGAGSNPLITRTDAGTGTTASTGGIGDAIFRLSGTDYFTWNQINLAATDQGIEYGFMTIKPNGTNGCQNLNILKSSITMTKGTSGYVIGIYISNGPIALNSAEGVTVTANSGRNSNIVINGNTISNVHSGIYCRGSSAAGYPDENISIGDVSNTNYIRNFGGGATTVSYAIHMQYVSNPSASFNDIDNQLGGGPHGGPMTLILFSSVSGTVVASNNALIATNNSASSNIEYIYINNKVESIIVEANIFAAYTLSTTGGFFLIRATGCTDYLSISENSTYGNITLAGGSTYCIYNNTTQPGVSETIYNNSFTDITVNSGSGSLNGIIAGSGPDSFLDCSANYISDLVHNATGSVNGISLTSSSNYLNGNIVQDLSGSGEITGIRSSGISNNLFNNTVKNLTTAGPTLYGIYCLGDWTTYIYRNQVYNLTSTYSSPAVVGIRLAESYLIYVYNNFISDLKAPSANASIPLAGIYAVSGTTVNLFYNTIFLNASSSGALFGSAGIYVSTVPIVDMRNNNIVNISTPNGASGYTVAYRRTNATLSTYSTSSNANNFFAGTPGPNRLIFYDGTNALQTLDAYKSFVNTRDGASITENPPFINAVTAPYNLHLQAATATQCESGGMPISSPINIITDIDGQSRNANTPDIGADEFSGIKTDLVPPAIAFIPLKNTSGTGNRTLVTTMTDASGVPTSGSGLPMLYWRVNGGAYAGVQATYISGRRYDFTFAGGVAVNDLVEYYVVAQDLSGTPKVGSNPWSGATGFTASPPACGTPPTAPYSYTIEESIGGLLTVGSGGDYPSLTGDGGLFASINARIVTGNITASVISDLTEDATHGLNEWLEEGGAFSLTIQPDGATLRNITGNYIDGLIRLNGCDRVIFDGRFNGNGRYLHFSNSSISSSTAVIHIISDSLGANAEDITIRNCTISGGSNVVTSAYAIYAGGSSIAASAGGYGISNLSILENQIQRAYYGLYAEGASDLSPFSGCLISGNKIGSDNPTDYVSYRGIELYRVAGPVISGNEIYNINIGTLVNNCGIWINFYVTDALIDGNWIHHLESSNPDGWGTYGINIFGSGIANITITNNLIHDLYTYGWGDNNAFNPFGIRIESGTGHKILNNTVDMNGFFEDGLNDNRSAALIVGSSGTEVRNNIFVNRMTVSNATECYAIYSTSASIFSSINHNNYHVSGPNATLGYLEGQIFSLAGWQAATGQDASSISANPLFTGTELHLQNPASPCIGSGTPLVDVTSDYSGNPRHPAHPTMGAREYVPSSNWLGNTNAWNAGSNWSRNTVPDDSYNVIIPSSPEGGNFPVVPTGVFQCNTLHLEAGSSLIIQGQLEVKNIQP